MIVVDASVLVVAVADDGPDGARIRRRILDEDDRLAAPDLVDLEVLSALRRLCRSGNLSAERAEAALSDLEALRLQRIPHRSLLARCWELCENITVYDAAYIAAAELFDARVLTADSHLANAPGARCSFEILT